MSFLGFDKSKSIVLAQYAFGFIEGEEKLAKQVLKPMEQGKTCEASFEADEGGKIEEL